MEHVDIAHVPAEALRTQEKPYMEPYEAYTPGDFLSQFATVIAICLGLAMLAHLLVFMAGI